MISRVADHCFWFGRYVERAEATARTLAAANSLALDAELPAAQVWQPVLAVSGEEATFEARIAAGRASDGALGDGEIVQRFIVWDADHGASLVRSIGDARWNARSIREVLSLETWEVVNELHLWIGSPEAASLYATSRDGFYQHVRRTTQLALGLARSTMLHDEPLDFLWLGVLLERTSQTARMLDVHHHALLEQPTREDVVETAVWLSVLRALSGSEAYVKRSAGRLSAEGVARFLVSEAAFPRSIAYCVQSAYARLCDIRPPEQHERPGGRSLERLRVLASWVTARTAEPMAGMALHELLTHVVDEVHEICRGLGSELLGAPVPSQSQSQ